jgi:serine/threonine protein kinase
MVESKKKPTTKEKAKDELQIKYDKAWFIQSRTGNIKDEYFFEKKLGSGGYGAVYLARNKNTGTRTQICLTSWKVGE